MSGQELRAAQARLETCQYCRRWTRTTYWAENIVGRCGKYTRRNVMTSENDTCENFIQRKKELEEWVME